MKKNVVRILALLLAGLLCLSLIPLISYADWCAHEHLTTVMAEPVCGEDGYTAAQCLDCGEIFGYEIIPHTEEHDFSACVESEDYLISEGNCTEPTLYYKSCSKCGYIAEFYYQQAMEQMRQSLWEQHEREVAFHGREVSDWSAKLEQATQEIENRYTFKVGGEGHRFYEVERQPATCTSDGWEAYQLCADCGAIEGYEIIPAKGHRFGEFVVTAEPTCTEAGTRERVCDVCGELEQEAIPAPGHQFGTDGICTVCGEEEQGDLVMADFAAFDSDIVPADDVQAGNDDGIQAGNDDVQDGNGDAQNGNGDAQDGNGDAQNGNGDAQNGNDDAQDGNDDAQNGNGDAQNGNGDAQNGNGDDAFNTGDTDAYGAIAVSLSIDEGEKYEGVVLAGQTLRATCTPELPEGYTVYWIPKRGDTNDEQNVPMIPGESYTVPETYIDGTIVCVVVDSNSNDEAGRSDTLRIRKEVALTVTARGEGEMRYSFTRLGDEGADTVDNLPPVFLTGDRITFSVTPGVDQGYIFRRIASVRDNTITAQDTEYDSETNTYSYTFTLSTSSPTSYLLEADRPNLYNEEKPTLGNDSDIYISKAAEKALEDRRKELADTYGDEAVKSGVIRYVTPIWTSDALVMGKSAVESAISSGLLPTFVLSYPEGIDYKTDIVQAYHYNAEGKWDQISEDVYKLTEEGVEVSGFTDFSPFAVIAIDQVAITLDANNGSGETSSASATLGSKYTAPACSFTAPEGKVFGGWNTQADGKGTDYAVGADIEVTGPMTLYAKWVDGYTISFNDNDGDNPNTYGALAEGEMNPLAVVGDGAGQTLPTNTYTLKDGDFQGWSFESGAENTVAVADGAPIADVKTAVDAYNSTAAEGSGIDGSFTLYAVWKMREKTTCTVSFDANGGSGAMDPQTAAVGSSITLKKNAFTAPDTNKLFAGWSDSATGDILYKDGDTIQSLEKDVTLYAVWRDKITIHFYSKSASGTGTGSMNDQTVPSGVATALEANAFTAPSGMAFKEWNTRHDGTGTAYKDKDAVTLNVDTYLYAQWRVKPIVVTFNANGGSGTMEPQPMETNTATELNPNTFTAPEGKIFKCWNTKADGSGTEYKDKDTVTLNADTVLYAQWDIKIPVVTFDANGGSGTMEPQPIEINVATKLNPNTFTPPEGKMFKCWNTKADGSGTDFKDEATVKISKDVTLYAQWIVGRTITFDKNAEDATGTMDDQIVDSGVATALTANAFRRVNYEFEGWATNPDGSGTKYADQGTVTTTTDLTLYAVWKQVAYAITYDANGGGGDSMAQQNVPIGTSTTIRECGYNAKPGEVFAYWEDQDGNHYAPGDTIEPSKDLALKAVWVEELTISYYPGEGSGSYNEGAAPKGVPTDVKTAAEAGFTAPAGATFAYWQDKKSAEKYYVGTKYTFNENAQLDAIWAKAVTITFDRNGGSGSMANQVVPSDVETALNPNTFSRSEYIFKYWTKTRSDPYPNMKPDEVTSGDVYQDGAKVTLSQDTTFYAQWYKTAISKVSIVGEVTGLDDYAVWGETLTAVVSDPVLRSGFTYTWLVDGVEVKSGPENTYEVKQEDYGKTIVCVASHPQATNTVESNTKIVGPYAEEEDLVIINNGDPKYPYSRYAYIYGVVPGTTFLKDGRSYLVPESATDGIMELSLPGVYTFGNVTYYVENWFTVGYEVADNSGGGTVVMRNGSTQLTSSTNTSDIQHYVNNVWLVRDGAATDLSITMKPASSTYVHWSLNGGSYNSSSTEVSRRLGTIRQPMLFSIVFNKSSSSPRTGDMSHLGMWSALCFTSLVGAASVIGASRKRRKNRD